MFLKLFHSEAILENVDLDDSVFPNYWIKLQKNNFLGVEGTIFGGTHLDFFPFPVILQFDKSLF